MWQCAAASIPGTRQIASSTCRVVLTRPCSSHVYQATLTPAIVPPLPRHCGKPKNTRRLGFFPMCGREVGA